MPHATLLTCLALLAAGPALAQSSVLSTTPSTAQSPVQSQAMQVYGSGSISCATYLQDRSIRINADGWILGLWTGMNRTAESHGVGHTTDSRGLVGEVARVCRGQPSVSIFETEKQVYDKMKAEGR